ncbi:Spy0128 family protein [Parolsenella catena]|uniref:Spy0128 family protein n=1 Tax=Parolsenella catena TaxID=2003188 RepID=UPI001897D140|nr:FctA domain-containing protein [Parolsenella catena]
MHGAGNHTPADVNTNPMKMSYSPEVSSSGDVLKYVTSDGSLPIIYADTGINRMRIQQDGKPKKGDDLGTMRLNQLFTSVTGVQYTDQRVARLEVTKQVTSDSGVTAPSTDTNGGDLTFEYTFRLPSNGLLGSAINNTQEYDAQVFDASGDAVGDSFKLKDGDRHSIKAGETIRVYGLAAGDDFTVTETGKHEDLGFSLVSRKKGNEQKQGEGDAISGTIVETTSSGDISQNNRLTFTNNYSPIPATLDGSANLRVTKSLVNEDGSARDWDEGDAFTFTLAAGDEATADAVKEGLITLPDNASGLVISRDAANHASEFGDITFKVAGTFTFDVAESRGADAKPSTAYDMSVKHVRVSVADKGNGQLAASVERSSDTLAFTNIYKTPKKVYRAGDDAKASIDGQTVSAGDKITYELAWVNNTGADARVSVTDTLPQGVEFVSASDGGTPSADGTAVTWDLGQQPTDASGTVTLTVRVTGVFDEAGTDEIANTAKVTVGENSYDTNTVTVKAEKCSLEISKTVEGGDPNREFTFDVTLGNADGTPFAGTLGAKRYSEGQDTPEDVSVTFDAEGKAQLTLKAGQRIVVSRLSKSARYTVREQPAAGYTATVNGQDGSEATGVLDSGVTSVSFNNAYATDTYVAHTDNLLSKTLVGRDWADGESFSFTMTLAQGDASGVTYNGSATASKPASGNKATFGFGDMTFTRPGTYVFDVTEDGASAAGLEKDTHTATLTVTVRDDGLGHLVVDGAVPVIVSDGDFTNTYSSNLDYGVAGGLKLEKTLDGHAMAAGQFQFTLKAVDEDGAVAASESAALLGLPEAGKVFDSPASDDGVAAAVNLLPDDGLVLTQANANKTYAFELTETRGGGAGYTNDSQVHKVRIAVTDDGAGTLTATTTVDGTAYVYKTGDSGVENPAKVYLTNSYQASGEATIKAEKVLRGRDQVAGEFHFTVTDKQGSTVATGTNAADGAITFDKPLSYTQADVGTHVYTVTETGNLPSGVRGIVTQLAVEVSVTDNGDGTLRASVACPDGADHLTFVNEYGADASASVSLNGTKCYDAPAGEGYATPDIEGKFAFTLTGADGAPMPSGSDGQAKTVRNAAGNVDFGEVAYTMADAGKTYEYTIAEAATDDSPKGVSVDGGTRVVRVSVTDNGDGTISATATDGDGNSLGTGSKFSFTNAYRVTQTSATIQGTKSLEGRELCDGEFTFELLEDGRQVAMTSNDAEGRFSFDLTYDKPGEHEYVVREVVPGETRGVSFDTHEAVAHVSVSDNGAGALVANVTYPGGDVSFKNTYAAEGTSARIVAVKRLEGATLADGQFTFQLSDAETGTVLQSATNAADGSVTFALGYGAADAGKTFTYKVSERNDGQAGVTYDGSSYTVKVEVTDDGEGHLSAKASTDDYLVFTNRYDAGGSGESPGGSPDVETPPAKQLPQTSDPLAGPGFEASIAVAGIAAIVVAALVRRHG